MHFVVFDLASIRRDLRAKEVKEVTIDRQYKDRPNWQASTDLCSTEIRCLGRRCRRHHRPEHEQRE